MGTNPCSGRGGTYTRAGATCRSHAKICASEQRPSPRPSMGLTHFHSTKTDPAVESLAEQLDRLDINTISTSIKEPPYRQFIIDEPLVY